MWEKPFDLTKGVVSFHRKQNISWMRPLPAYNIPSGVAIDTECSFLCDRILCHCCHTIYRMKRSVFVTIVCKRVCLLNQESQCTLRYTPGVRRYFHVLKGQYFYYWTLFPWAFIHEDQNIVVRPTFIIHYRSFIWSFMCFVRKILFNTCILFIIPHCHLNKNNNNGI